MNAGVQFQFHSFCQGMEGVQGRAVAKTKAAAMQGTEIMEYERSNLLHLPFSGCACSSVG